MRGPEVIKIATELKIDPKSPREMTEEDGREARERLMTETPGHVVQRRHTAIASAAHPRPVTVRGRATVTAKRIPIV